MGIIAELSGKRSGRIARKPVAAYEPLESRLLFAAVVVNSIKDQLDPAGSNTVTLRDAIAVANASTTPTTITFDSEVFATQQTIKLDGSRLIIKTQSAADTVTITAPAAGLVIDGNHASGDFVVWSDTTASLSGFTLTGGRSGNGAGIDSYGNVTVTDTTITGNYAPNGGGVFNSGTATFQDDTISSNIGSTGGGFWNTDGGHLSLTDVTISKNSARYGGGIFNGGAQTGTTTLSDCTIAGNTAYMGGGVYNTKGSTVNVGGSIIATNKRLGGSSGSDVSGVFSSTGLNLIGNADGSSGWISTDQTGTSKKPLNPKLNALASNGGATPTITLQPGSPALGGATETPTSTTVTPTAPAALPVPTVLGSGVTSTTGTVTTSNSPTFTWDAISSGITGYQLNLYDITAKKFVSFQIVASQTSFTVPTALANGDSFVWNLRVVNGTTTGTESAYLYFQTPVVVPASLPVPTVIGPGIANASGVAITTTTPTFTWDAISAGITGYQLNLYNITTKAFVSYQIGASATSFTLPTALPRGDSFVWNLRVFSGSTTGSESAYLYFQT